MAITYPLTLPNTTSFKSFKLRAISNVAVTKSPFTYSQQVLKFKGATWEADVSLKSMQRADAEEWVAFFLKLQGQYGTFLMGDPSGATPRGSAASAAGTPLVDGANQTGTTLHIDGCPNSATNYLRTGDYIQVGTGAASKLYKVLSDVDTDATGNADIEVYPEIFEAHDDNTTITVTDCVGVFRLSSNESNWDINTDLFYGLTFGAVEAI